MATRVETVTLALRDMILKNELASGERIQEIAIAKRLNVSRTPVRLALGVLENEGLVVSEPNRGFSVRTFTLHEILSAVDVRGVLEGLACRLIAENGLRKSTETALNQCLQEGRSLLSVGHFDEFSASKWSEMNEYFHHTLLEAADSPPLSAAHALNSRLPLVGAGAIAFSSGEMETAFQYMQTAHAEHERIVTALQQGEAARAENLIREHAFQSRDDLRSALEGKTRHGSIQALRLITG